MRYLLTFVIALLLNGIIFSQENETNEANNNFGPNKTHFINSYVNLGFMLPPKDGNGADIIYGKSNSFSYGIKYRYKITERFFLGIALYYNHQSWHMKQEEDKIVPVSTLYDNEKIILNNLGGEFFIRLKFGEKENGIGNYINIAPYSEFAFKTLRETKTKSSNVSTLGEDYNIQTNVNLNYIETLQYGLQIKVYIGRFGITGKYRLSDLFSNEFKDLVSSTELPRLNIVIELELHK